MKTKENPEMYDQTNPKRLKEYILKPDLSGLVNPLNDIELVEDLIPTAPSDTIIPPLSPVWVRMVGFRPAWSPAIVSFVFPASASITNRYFVFFIQGEAFEIPTQTESSENSGPDNAGEVLKVPSWVKIEQATQIRKQEDKLPHGVQYAWISDANIKPWTGEHVEGFIKTVNSLDARKKRLFKDAISHGDRMLADKSSIPRFVVRDSNYRKSVQEHSDEVSRELGTVRPALKLQHLKIFLEANMMELHWRTIAYARQFVKAVKDEVFGGYHLIAAQDWPRDRDVDNGIPEVFLVYPGAILSEQEAFELESSCKSGIHEDRNRYVAEIPNTAVIYDKTGKVNINYTGRNLFVDGFKYADPTSPVWAPGPTVNHERTKYCKLAPHHVSGTDTSLRGFWLQRKRGEVIIKGEPLFWSYDCGAGKFDADFGLVTAAPPIGWISTREILALEEQTVGHKK
jgi:hypothetical protein